VAYNAKTGEKVNIHDLNSIQDQIDRLGSAKIDVIDPLDIEEDENKVVRESQNGRIKGRDINVALLAERCVVCGCLRVIVGACKEVWVCIIHS
ncbi:hypothetical protein SARC_12009, partial [Sphaeroforma arctica JP610]